ncbi:hypothetical protein GCM10008018_17130 [Paenibacillus marchantiophytorum]|uniref:SLH domain-containing protein n=2 Tax=Paenibacillus marchantiophytorum TaxID=1619310 RepID=A0ABQ2BTL2_9BACL|nr:hypothetical protein GCM10008018_17130 [Paenibacillus marchantiophytorum]
MAVMVARVLHFMRTDDDGVSVAFADQDQIPSWAKESLAAVVKKGIVKGRDNN